MTRRNSSSSSRGAATHTVTALLINSVPYILRSMSSYHCGVCIHDVATPSRTTSKSSTSTATGSISQAPALPGAPITTDGAPLSLTALSLKIYIKGKTYASEYINGMGSIPRKETASCPMTSRSRIRQDSHRLGPAFKRFFKKFVKVITNKYIIVTVIFAVIVIFVDRNNLIRWAGDYLTALRQEKVIRQYNRDIQMLDDKLDELTSDKDSLEKFAREQYYFHKKGEDVFIVD